MGHGGSKVPRTEVVGDDKIIIKRSKLKNVPFELMSKYPNIKHLDLSYNFITYLEPDISRFTNLTELSLSHNMLTARTLPPQLASLPRLYTLNLSYNSITSFPDILNITTLQTLNLSHNNLSTIPQELTKLVRLQSVNFRHNKISEIPNLEALPSLFILDVSRNSIKALPKSLKQITTLRMLQLANNQLTKISSYHTLTNLTHLDIHDNRLSKLPEKLVDIVDTGSPQTYGKLKELNVRDNKELLNIPANLAKAMRPPLLLNTSIPAEVVEKVFLGGLDSATNMPLLQHLRITHIILAIGEMPPHFPKSFSYLVLHDAKDSPNFDFSVYFDECAQFIDSAVSSGGGVLIHCRAGVSRSPTIVIAYMMKYHRMRFAEALDIVTSKRAQALPNTGFREQLLQYEIKLFDMHPVDHHGGNAHVPLPLPPPQQPQTTENIESIGVNHEDGVISVR